MPKKILYNLHLECPRDEHGLFVPGDTDLDWGARRVSLGDILSRPAASSRVSRPAASRRGSQLPYKIKIGIFQMLRLNRLN